MFVRITGDWVDPTGVSHRAGDVLDLDAVSAVELETAGAGVFLGPTYAQEDTLVVGRDAASGSGTAAKSTAADAPEAAAEPDITDDDTGRSA
jgi:hypothetical protein